MVERYGDFVLYRPPVKAVTLLLWFGPPVLLLLGTVGADRQCAQTAHAYRTAAVDRRGAERGAVFAGDGKGAE